MPGEHRPGHVHPARVRVVQGAARPPPVRQARRPGPLHACHPPADRGGVNAKLGGLGRIPAHQRHARRVIRLRLAVQRQLRTTEPVTGKDLLNVPEPLRERIILGRSRVAQHSRSRQLCSRGLDQEPRARVRQQHRYVHLPPGRTTAPQHVPQQRPAALDLGNGELLAVIDQRQPRPQRRGPPAHSDFRRTESPDSGTDRSVVRRPDHSNAISGGRASHCGRPSASRSSAAAS